MHVCRNEWMISPLPTFVWLDDAHFCWRRLTALPIFLNSNAVLPHRYRSRNNILTEHLPIDLVKLACKFMNISLYFIRWLIPNLLLTMIFNFSLSTCSFWMSSTLNYIIFMAPEIKPKAFLLLNKYSTIAICIAP